MLAKRLAVRSAATGLTAASPTLIAPRSSTMAPGSFPSRNATRFTADFRSRSRVPDTPPGRSKLASREANVTGSAEAAACWGVLRLGFFVMTSSFREFRVGSRAVSGGQVVTGADIRDIYYIIDGWSV